MWLVLPPFLRQLPAVQICIDSKSVFKATQTSSGNFLVVDNSSFAYAITQSDQLLVTNSTSKERHVTLKSGETQVLHQQLRVVTEFAGITCTQELRIQEANGQVLFNESRFTCTS